MAMPYRSLRRQLNALLKPTVQPSLNVAFVRPGAPMVGATLYAVPSGEDWTQAPRHWFRRAAAALTSMTFLSAGAAAYAVYALGQHPVALSALPSWSQPWVAAHATDWPRAWGPSPVLLPVTLPTVILPASLAADPEAVTAPVMSAADREAELRKRQEAVRQAQLLNRQEALAGVISAQYFIAQEAALLIVQQAYQAADAHHVDPLLLLALTGVESRFNPFAGSNAGALGLTQPMPGAHPDKIQPLHQRGGSILNVRDNLDLGAQILREYLAKFNNNVVLALQQYNGALNDSRHAYATRVLRALAPLKTAADKADHSFKG